MILWVFLVYIDSLCFTKYRLFLPLQDDYFRTWSPGKPFDQGKILLLVICMGQKLSIYTCTPVPEYLQDSVNLCQFVPLHMIDLFKSPL